MIRTRLSNGFTVTLMVILLLASPIKVFADEASTPTGPTAVAVTPESPANGVTPEAPAGESTSVPATPAVTSESPTAAVTPESPVGGATAEPTAIPTANPSPVATTTEEAPPTDSAVSDPPAATTAAALEPTDQTTTETNGPAAVSEEITPTQQEFAADAEYRAQVAAIEKEAADSITNSDPVWCPTGSDPSSGPGCTPPQASLADLITLLANPANGFTGNGSIYLEAGAYNGGSTTTVVLDNITAGGNLSTSNLGTIAVYGGWTLSGPGSPSHTGTTTFAGALQITWNNAVTLQDLVFTPTANNPNAAVFVDTDVSTSHATDTISVTNVTVTQGSSGQKYSAGAELINYNGTGNVTVNNSNFNDTNNEGLLVDSSGNVTLTSVGASGNHNGIIIDNTTGTGDISLNSVTTNGNGWNGVDARTAGNITVNTITANNNIGGDGAYLDATGGTGNIFVTGGTFTGNDVIGLKAITNTGNVTLNNSNFYGHATPLAGSLGAWLKSYGGGTVAVTSSVFQYEDTGLEIVGTGPVTVTNVTADHNLSHGVFIQSGWVFGCFGPTGINSTVDGGSYHDNGGYGFVVYPGPNGTLTLAGAITFLPANGSGDYLLDLTKTCTPPPPCDDTGTDAGKPYNVVNVLADGTTPVTLDCVLTSGAKLVLPSNSSSKITCPASGDFLVNSLVKDKLPGPLAGGLTFVESMNVSLTADGTPVTVLTDGSSITLSFQIPEGMEGKKFSIMFWDPSVNQGAGGWIELPLNQFTGQSFPLHPDSPQDGMEIMSGIQKDGHTITAKVNFTGIFVLVAR
jgi:hypothetical protein